MENIAIYFDLETMYNLEDSSVIGHFLVTDSKELYERLISMKEEYTINMAIIGFNHPLRNALYTVFPQVTLVINPVDVQQMITRYLCDGQIISRGQEEIAATLIGELASYQVGGCQGIYDYPSKQAAISYYKRWQAEVPLGIKSFHHVIRIMDYYYEEIFNNFDIQAVLRGERL